MKKVNFMLIIALILAMASFSGCESTITDSMENDQHAVGYIVGFTCPVSGYTQTSETTGIAEQYYIITENLQDTFLTCNWNCELPLDFFTGVGNDSIKINFNYTLVPVEERNDYIPACPTMYWDPYGSINRKFIFINSFNFE